MILTVPIIRPGLATNVRTAWKCADFRLPEPLTVGDWRLDPGEHVRVKEVRFASVGMSKDQPWTVVWVTVEIPDGFVGGITFPADNPKRWVSPADRESERQEARKRTLAALRHAPVTTDDVMRLHERRMADSEPDTGVSS